MSVQSSVPRTRAGVQPKQPTTTKIVVGPDEARVNDEIVRALSRAPHIFERAGALVSVDRPADDPPRLRDANPIRVIAEAALREDITRLAYFVDDRGAPKAPPPWCAREILARGRFDGIRKLRAVLEHPCLLPSGRIVTTPGYDVESALFLTSTAFVDITSSMQPKAAADTVRRLLVDFPFEDQETGVACWLAGALTVLARHAFEGPAPLFLFDANMPGVGKSRLVDLIAIIATGHTMPRQPVPSENDEMRKLLTSVCLTGQSFVFFDNLDGPFGCGALDAALTSEIWQDRQLGTNRAPSLPMTATFFATGNNVDLAGDLRRRCLYTRLVSELEHPDARTQFEHPDLLGFAKRNQGALLAALLSVLRGHAAEGFPGGNNAPAYGSFEAWSRVVRGAVIWCGLPDPCASRTKAPSARERSLAALAEVLAVLRQRTQPMSAKEIAYVPGLKAALEEIAPARDGLSVDIQKLGLWLASNRGAVVGSFILEEAGRSSPRRWRAVAVGSVGPRGPSPPAHQNHQRGDDVGGTPQAPEPQEQES